MAALPGILLLWGNKKRHAVWITTALLIFFLSAGWSPIYRLALPMIPLMMALGWAAYVVALENILKLLNMIPVRGIRDRFQLIISGIKGNTGQKIREVVSFIDHAVPYAKQRLSFNSVAGFLIFCWFALPVIMMSVENIDTAIEKSGYPYRDGAKEWMDVGKWLNENAPPDSITMTRNPWELHFYSDQLAIQIPLTDLEKTIEVMSKIKATHIIPQLNIRPSLKPLVTGEVPGLELTYDNKKLQLFRINYELLPE